MEDVVIPATGKSKCSSCSVDFSLRKRKRKCRMCSAYFCSDCCSARVTFPPSCGFSSPKFACNDCLPKVFTLRTSSEEHELTREAPEKSPSPKTKRTQVKRCDSGLKEGSFHTKDSGSVHNIFKMADPVCRMFFRFSGMYDGGKFDRGTLQAAMRLNKAVVKLPSVGKVKRYYIRVPVQVKEEDWSVKALYQDPPFLNPELQEGEEDDEETESIEVKDEDIREEEVKKWGKISVFVYRPKHFDPEEELPVVMWYHGGGFCIGSIEDSFYELICRTFSNSIKCIVVSVEYRLAPEYVFPVPVEDAYWALVWVHKMGKELFNADVSRIAVAGDSAGGSLSALMCILTKLRSGPKISHQVLVYPCLSNPCNDTYESQVTYKNGPLLTRKIMEWFMDQCLGDSSKEPRYLFPLLLDDEELEGMPPATIINAQHDPLLDHGTAYFQKLRRVDVPVSHTVYGTSIHGFFGSQIGESDEAVVEAVTALKNCFA